MRPVHIEHERQGRKRTFKAWLVSCVTADRCWDGGLTDTRAIRPVFAVFLASQGAARPVQANLARGVKAVIYRRDRGPDSGHPEVADRVELLRSAGYRWSLQPTAGGAVALTAWLPQLFQRDPGLVDPDRVSLVVLPRAAWVSAQRWDAEPLVAHLEAQGLEDFRVQRWAAQLPQARLLGEALDRRTRAPFPATDRFLVQLAARAEEENVLLTADNRTGRRIGSFQEHGVEDIGLLSPLAVAASQAQVEDLLAREVRHYFTSTPEVAHGAA